MQLDEKALQKIKRDKEERKTIKETLVKVSKLNFFEGLALQIALLKKELPHQHSFIEEVLKELKIIEKEKENLEEGWEEQIENILRTFKENKESFLKERVKRPYGDETHDYFLYQVTKNFTAEALKAKFPLASKFIEEIRKEREVLQTITRKPRKIDLKIEEVL